MNLKFSEIKDPRSELIPEIIRLEKEAFGGPAALNEWTLPMLMANGKVFVLELDGKVCAEAGLLRQWTNPPGAYLVTFCVANAKRRQGVGSFLLTKVVESLAAEGFSRLSLTVSPDNLAARSLYEGAGFKTISFLPEHYGPGEDRLLMELRLDSKRG